MTGSEDDELEALTTLGDGVMNSALDSVMDSDEAWLRQIAHAPVPPPPPTAVNALRGQVLAGRYQLGDEVGRGGMGAVYRAQDLRSGAGVAVKFATTEGPATERLLREGVLLTELRHPGIVAVLETGRLHGDSGPPYLVMEWLSGEDLAHRLRRGPLSVAEAQALLSRAAAALAYAHGRGVVHRDLKPNNLYLREGRPEDVVILDFGVARGDDSVAMTRTGAILGTPAYMAPEQITSARAAGPAADVFSLGCVVYHCLTGAPPFQAEFVDQLLLQIVTTDAPPLSARCPQAPAELCDLIARMLRRDPAARLLDGAALLRALPTG